MSNNRTLLYMFRDKVETSVVDKWMCTHRRNQLYGVTGATVYLLEPDGHLYTFASHIWTRDDSAPNEIKLAAALLI